MDANTAFTITNVTAVYKDETGWRVGFIIPQTAPAPSDYSDALTYTDADWPNVTNDQVASDMTTRWNNWISVVQAQVG